MTKIPYLNGDGLKGKTWNMISGCSGIGCKVRDHCWARKMVRRFPVIHGWLVSPTVDDCGGLRIPFSTVQFHPDRLNKPLHWKRPRRIGVCFLGDLFDDQVPYEWQQRVFEITLRCPQHEFFFLTKQPRNMVTTVLTSWEKRGMPIADNWWFGVSITDQPDADWMIPELLRIPGKHWGSIEPMLGPVKIPRYVWLPSMVRGDGPFYGTKAPSGLYLASVNPNGAVSVTATNGHLLGVKPGEFEERKLDWVVLGCESGHKRLPCPHEWMIDVVRQCKAAGVPVYCKQIQDVRGKVIHDINLFPKELQIREAPNAIT